MFQAVSRLFRLMFFALRVWRVGHRSIEHRARYDVRLRLVVVQVRYIITRISHGTSKSSRGPCSVLSMPSAAVAPSVHSIESAAQIPPPSPMCLALCVCATSTTTCARLACGRAGRRSTSLRSGDTRVSSAHSTGWLVARPLRRCSGAPVALVPLQMVTENVRAEQQCSGLFFSRKRGCHRFAVSCGAAPASSCVGRYVSNHTHSSLRVRRHPLHVSMFVSIGRALIQFHLAPAGRRSSDCGTTAMGQAGSRISRAGRWF